MNDVPCGLVVWWSTFHQRWNVTAWKGYDDVLGKIGTEVSKVRGIVSDKRLLEFADSWAARLFPYLQGESRVIEPGYVAVWSTDPDYVDYLASQAPKLVCREI